MSVDDRAAAEVKISLAIRLTRLAREQWQVGDEMMATARHLLDEASLLQKGRTPPARRSRPASDPTLH